MIMELQLLHGAKLNTRFTSSAERYRGKLLSAGKKVRKAENRREKNLLLLFAVVQTYLSRNPTNDIFRNKIHAKIIDKAPTMLC